MQFTLLARPDAVARRAVLPFAAALALLTACGGDGGSTEPASSAKGRTIAIVGDAGPLRVGDRRPLSAVVRDASGEEVPNAPIAWSSSNPSALAVVDGLLEGLAPGIVEVRASSGSLVSKRTITVYRESTGDPAPIYRLGIFPRSITLAPGARARLLTRVSNVPQSPSGMRDLASAPEPFGAGIGVAIAALSEGIRYRSTAPEVASVSADGTITALGEGIAEIVAEVGTLSARTRVVVSDPPPHDFHIDVEVVGEAPPTFVEILQRAARRWERAIVRGAPPQPLTMAAGGCDPWTPAIDRVVNHLLVLVRLQPIDGAGRILAGTRVCVHRAGMRQPVLASVEFDSADLRDLEMLEATAIHELGHALGFGTAWWGEEPAPALVEQLPSQRLSFVGRWAREAGYQWGITASSDVAMWIEDRGGPGSAGSHWDNRQVGGEMMTAGGGPPASLSLVSIAAMRDLGYDVDERAADWEFTPPREGPLSLVGVASPFERLKPARWTVDPHGRLTALP